MELLRIGVLLLLLLLVRMNEMVGDVVEEDVVTPLRPHRRVEANVLVDVEDLIVAEFTKLRRTSKDGRKRWIVMIGGFRITYSSIIGCGLQLVMNIAESVNGKVFNLETARAC